MDLSTISLPDFVKNAEILWLKGEAEYTPVMRRSGIVKEVPISNNTGDTRDFSEIDLEMYAKAKPEREEAKYARVQQGYSKTGRLYRIAFAEGITHEMRTRGKYIEVQNRLKNLLPTALRRMELDLQHRITFANSNSYTNIDGDVVDTTVGDGLSLANTAHTVKGSSETFRNILATNPQLSRSSLEAMEVMRIENSINQFGQKVPVSDDILWTTDDPNTTNTARELLKSTATTNSNQNEGVINVYSSKYRLVVLPLVATDREGNPDTSKSKYWGLASSMKTALYLGVHEEPNVIPPNVGDGRNVLTDDWYMNVRAGYMIVTPAATWFGMSKGDGSA